MHDLRAYIFLFGKTNRSILLKVVVASLLQIILLLPVFFCTEQVFNHAIPEQDHMQVALYGAGMVLFFFLSSSMGLVIRWGVLRIVKEEVKELRNKITHHFLVLEKDAYVKMPKEKLQLVMMAEVERLDGLLNAVFGVIVPSMIVVGTLLLGLMYLDFLLFLYTAGLFLVLFILPRKMNTRAKKLSEKYHNAYDVLHNKLRFADTHFNLIHHKATKGKEGQELNYFIDNLYIASLKMVKHNTLFKFVYENMMVLIAITLVLIGANQVIAGAMSLGALISFYVVVGLLRSYVSSISSIWPEVILGNQSRIKIHRFLSSPSMSHEGSLQVALKGNISFKNVSFAYGEKEILNELTFQVRAGECIMLVGENGSGKSTLIDLLLGFYMPQKGCVYVENEDLSTLDLDNYRSQVGVVEQHPTFFAGTIYENIAYGMDEVSPQDVTNAIEWAGVRSFIDSLKGRENTSIGIEGGLISGGQKQRIAIARALVRQPSLLVLDEPTNHLDARQIKKLVNKLRGLPFEPTILLVTHHKEMHQLADRVFSLEEGKVKVLAPEK